MDDPIRTSHQINEEDCRRNLLTVHEVVLINQWLNLIRKFHPQRGGGGGIARVIFVGY